MQDELPRQQPEFIGVPDTKDVVSSDVAALSNNIARLETELDAEREQRLEERFRWICAMSLVLDVLAVSALDGSWLFVPIFMLQLIVMIGFAKAYGVDWAEQLIGQLLHHLSRQDLNKPKD
ncbi:hypothetical protein [Paracoccus fistulariae]|uniref:2TM domain-containing protein n=1 Tax=Paracoccus fistulariae TaxID=658446 RepID=A0ABY7SHL2_9RHOB|nr:hypothetical protein [Paracoccus fistulariae]MDB6181151.1 hypothetical protein [Paracoccus fistulariae]WCR06438.1 hypothetical protein JHX87_13190 [Paracoccus fistulariae]